MDLTHADSLSLFFLHKSVARKRCPTISTLFAKGTVVHKIIRDSHYGESRKLMGGWGGENQQRSLFLTLPNNVKQSRPYPCIFNRMTVTTGEIKRKRKLSVGVMCVCACVCVCVCV